LSLTRKNRVSSTPKHPQLFLLFRVFVLFTKKESFATLTNKHCKEQKQEDKADMK